MSRPAGRFQRRSARLALALPLAACTGDLSTLDPAGPSAAAIATLWWTMLAGSVVIFVATALALAVAWLRPAALGARGPRTLVLWGGLVLPSLILSALVLAAFLLGERLIGRGFAAPLEIEAEGRQWSWEFRYPAAGGAATTDVLHIPAGRDVAFTVTSTDVIHSFWVPRLGGKIDAIPGHRNTIRLRADTPGQFGGVCAEFCGVGHGPMTFTVEVHPPEAYDGVLEAIAAGRQP